MAVATLQVRALENNTECSWNMFKVSKPLDTVYAEILRDFVMQNCEKAGSAKNFLTNLTGPRFPVAQGLGLGSSVASLCKCCDSYNLKMSTVATQEGMVVQ